VSDEKRDVWNDAYILIQPLLVAFGQMLLECVVGDHVREAVGKGRVGEPTILLF
jgi:hypothetical protein